MALTITIIAAFIAASVNASFVWQDDDNFIKDFKIRTQFPTFPTFPNFPIPKIPKFNIPTFPNIPPIKILTPEDIAKNKGPNYSGISVSSSSSSKVGKDGKVIQTGGGTIITNKGGVVKEYTYGDPQNVNIEPLPPIIIPQMPIWQPIIPMVPLDPEIIKTFQPRNNEQFFGTSSSSFSQSTDINGVITSAGGTNIVSNVNGDISEKSALYHENEV